MSDSFLSALPPLPLPRELRTWDAAAARLGIPEVLLMENAGKAAFDVLRSHMPECCGQDVWLFMGSGNNGGDAACLARWLLDAGAHPLVLHACPLTDCKGTAAKHARMAKAAGVAFAPIKRHMFKNPPAVLVDGLLGTGLTGSVRPELQAIIARINAITAQRACFVLALDIPSGLNAATGQPSPIAVRASATVSFAAAKPGLVLPEAGQWTGRLSVRPVGIPARIHAAFPCGARLLDENCLLSKLPQNAHKNSFGHLLVIGGAQGHCGAAHLAARAGLRAGAGLVTAVAPAANISEIKNAWPEIMTLALGAIGDWPANIPAELRALTRRCTALVVGPGMGRTRDTARFLEAFLTTLGDARPSTVFDADALTVLADNPTLLRYMTKTDILTPHPGEAAVLLGCDTKTVQTDRWAALKKLCALCDGVVLLKGAGTLVGQRDKPVLISPYDVPQLATAGSGDVLAGCLGALLAEPGEQPDERSSLCVAGRGVILHALAGLQCAKVLPLRGNTAGDIADALPLARLARQKPDEVPPLWK
ncbi:MAG: bifunctional NAD(P)H-hydrate repair enzyme Nnr [Candidatus Desulfovibrio kirbyi]|uniref:Bifunctional NAD(P)H-hydrate repair enzyme n=1 Tax=Candidatus Desulfovibrio kirbyi TaxID=2696086 RepID=A0A6L2R6T5_9BACT|nr:MAG: bifunctional NAD(P)H-hydrate repair enzyme Nnr [Candidatus Desulfovibrio kirbyi]